MSSCFHILLLLAARPSIFPRNFFFIRFVWWCIWSFNKQFPQLKWIRLRLKVGVHWTPSANAISTDMAAQVPYSHIPLCELWHFSRWAHVPLPTDASRSYLAAQTKHKSKSGYFTTLHKYPHWMWHSILIDLFQKQMKWLTKKEEKTCAICPQISAKKHHLRFEDHPAIMCGICGQTPLFMEFRVETEALTHDLCIQLGTGDGATA